MGSPAWSQSDDVIVVEDQNVTVQVEADGHYSVTEKTFLRAGGEDSREQLSEQKVSYDPLATDVQILDAGYRDAQGEHPLALESVVHHASSGTLQVLTVNYEDLPDDAVTWLTVKRSPKQIDPGLFSMDLVYGFLREERHGDVKILSATPLYYQVNDPHHVLKVERIDGGLHIRLLDAVLSVPPESLRVATQDELRAGTPRVQVSNVSDWNEFVNKRLAGMSELPLSTGARTFLAELKTLPSARAKVEKTFAWLAEASTDAAKPSSLALALLRAADVEVEPVLVGEFSEQDRLRFLHAPIDEDHPLPSSNYFNRLALRYRDGTEWRVVDPSRGLSEATRPPYYFRQMLAVNLGATTHAPYRILIPEADYADAEIHTELVRGKNGEYSATETVAFHGESANFIKDIYFHDGEAGLRTYLEAFASVSRHRAFNYRKIDFIDRGVGDLRFELTYSTYEPHAGAKRTLVMPPHYLPFFSRPGAGIKFVAFPMHIQEETVVKNAFAADEEKYDCAVLGPLATVYRTVRNEKSAVIVHDEVTLPTAVAPELSADDQSRMAVHATRLGRCAKAGEIVVRKSAGKLKTFAERAGFNHPYAPADIAEDDLAGMTHEWRRLEHYLQATPEDDAIWRERGRLFRRMGLIHGDVYLREYLSESERSLQRAIALNAKDASNFAELGITAYHQNELGKALDAFHRSLALDPKSFATLFLGGLVSQNADIATGYFASAAARAPTASDRLHALGHQAKTLKGTADALPVWTQILALAPNDPERLHLAAQAHAERSDWAGAATLDRRSLKIRDSVAARDGLLKALLAQAEDARASARGSAAEFARLERYLHEAYTLDEMNPQTLQMLVETNLTHAEGTGDPGAMADAEKYLGELRTALPDGDPAYELQAHHFEVVKQTSPPTRLPSSSGHN